MSNETRKPTHRIVRYYGNGQNAARAEFGAVWTNPDGSLSIRLDTLSDQIWLNGFLIQQDDGAA